jgi:hypothetical protein
MRKAVAVSGFVEMRICRIGHALPLRWSQSLLASRI